MKYSLYAIVFFILYVLSAFLSKDTYTAFVGMFGCIIMSELEAIHKEMRDTDEN